MPRSHQRFAALACAIALSLALSGCDDQADQPSAQSDAQVATATNVAQAATSGTPPAAIANVTPPDDIKTLSDAIASARPAMSDTQEIFSEGAKMLALWASDRIEWKELAAVPSTNAALVLKDSEDQLGKRICSSGQIVEISAEELAGKVYVGELFNMDTDNLFRFIALRSTGDLVEHNHARFCGVVTGKVDYANSMGGEEHAIQLVGMFDLPENHKPAADD